MKKDREIPRRLVGAAELAEALGVSVRTISRLKRAGVIVPVQVTAACPRYEIEDVLKRLRKQEVINDER